MMKYREKVFDNFLGLEWEEKFEIITKWLDKNPNFDRDFFDSVIDYYYQNGEVTEAQEEAITKIVLKFRIIK